MSTSITTVLRDCLREPFADETGKLYRVLTDSQGRAVSFDYLNEVATDETGTLALNVLPGRYKIVFSFGSIFFTLPIEQAGVIDLVTIMDVGPTFPTPNMWQDALTRTSF